MAPPINTLSMPTMRELQAMLQWWRSDAKYSTGERPPGLYPEGPFYTRWMRTQGPAATPDDEDYPTQVDGDGVRLPAKWLNVVYDEAVSDPCIVEVHDDGQDWFVYSPFGWIPRLVDVQVSYISGLMVVNYVPPIPVEINAAATAPDDVEVEIINYGVADTQTFMAHVRWLAGTLGFTVGQEAFAWLNPRLKRWEITNAECPA